jgi:RimJ/RimL family protein N-acetyltransferase
MTGADLGIGAGGTTAYERAALGLPSVMLTLAENQRGIARLLTKAGAAVDAGPFDDGLALRLRALLPAILSDSAARVRLGTAAAGMIDGRGGLRIMVESVEPIASKEGTLIRLRLAKVDDEAWLLDLQRQPCTRLYSRRPAIPSADEHHRWMNATLADPDRLLLIIEREGQAAGMIRLDRKPDEGGAPRHEIAIAVDSQRNGTGLGGAALRLLRNLMPGAVFDAGILPGNDRSLALFKHAGFVALPGDLYRSTPA